MAVQTSGGGVAEYLASWNSGAAKQAILGFVEALTTPGPGFAEPADRIATFDNDGTLWVEKPAPPQADFLIRVWTRAARNDPSLGSRQPYKAIIEQDMDYFQGLVTQDPEVVASLEGAVGETWAGTSPEVFDRRSSAGPRRRHATRCVRAGSDPPEDPRNFLPTPAPPPYQRPATRPVARREPGPAYRRTPCHSPAGALPGPYPALPPVPSLCHARRMTVVLALDPGSLFAARWKG